MRSFLLTSVNTKNFLAKCSKLPRRVKIDFNSLIKSYMNIQESYWSYNILGETFSDSLVIYGNSKNTIDKITFNRIELKKKMRLIYNANTDLELISKVEELKQSLEHYKKIEETLQNTLVMAQATAEDVKNVAKKQADQIISEAKGVAAQQVSEFDNEITMKRKELEDIKKQFDIYKDKMESLLISQLELLKDINKEDV